MGSGEHVRVGFRKGPKVVAGQLGPTAADPGAIEFDSWLVDRH